MSSQLPPYSTFRTDSKQMMYPQATSHGNILTFTPPGFKQSLNVKFPDSRLAVCEKCKKNFKTKDMCRVRNSHTAPPWTTAYVCVTVDDSCTDEDGNFIDKPMTLRMVTWRPFATRKPFHPKTPVCAGCKRTNRTRSFCRERHKHRQLPWCTVYVMLSALDQADPSTVVAGASKPVSEDDSTTKSPSDSPVGETKTDGGGPEPGQNGAHPAEENGDGKKAAPSVPSDVASASSETISSDVDEVGDDINDIPESRTFLAKVNSRGSSIHWLDLGEFEDTTTPTYSSPEGTSAFTTPALTPPPAIDPNTAQAHFYAQAHYAQQQHQNALKSHQQYFFEMQQRQQQQYSQWQQYAQQMAQTSAASEHPVTAGEAAAAASHARRQGEHDGVSPTNTAAAAAVTASPPVGQPPQQPPGAWPLYYTAPATNFYSPPQQGQQPGAAAAAATVGLMDPTNLHQQGQHADPYQAATAAEVAAASHQHHPQQQQQVHYQQPQQLPGGNSEDEPDAKRHRAI